MISLFCNLFVGRTYRFRISNVGLTTSINFRIQGHSMKLVEVEGSHTLQNTYTSLDIHLGQSYSVLVTADQPAQDYYVVVSSLFTRRVLTTTAILHYSNSRKGVSGPIPGGPTNQIGWSLNQARSIRYISFIETTFLTMNFPLKNIALMLFIHHFHCLSNQLESDCKWSKTKSSRLLPLWNDQAKPNNHAGKLCSIH